jgi:hypothetical protein
MSFTLITDSSIGSTLQHKQVINKEKGTDISTESGWCSWLSRSPHTRKVPGSNPGLDIFFPSRVKVAIRRRYLYTVCFRLGWVSHESSERNLSKGEQLNRPDLS